MSANLMTAALLTQPVAAITPEFVTAADVAAMLRVSRRTVFRLRQRGALPAPVEIARNIVRWRLADLRSHLDRLASRKPRRGK